MTRQLKWIGIATLSIAMMGAAGTTALGQDGASERRTGATIYRDGGYRGTAVYAPSARPNLNLSWRVNSIRVHSGSWELCSRPNFEGTCRTYDEDTA